MHHYAIHMGKKQQTQCYRSISSISRGSDVVNLDSEFCQAQCNGHCVQQNISAEKGVGAAVKIRRTGW